MKKNDLKKTDNESLKKYSEKLSEFPEINVNNKNEQSIEESEFYDNNNSRTILSEDLTKGSSINKNQNYNQNKNNFKKIKQNTIETVLENEGEENCSYNQNSDNRIVENDPIVTFLFYKETTILMDNETKIDSNKRENHKSNVENINNNDDNSLSLNFNRNYENKNEINININNNRENDNKVLNINDLIDNISQSEILANLNMKKDKSISAEKDNFELSRDNLQMKLKNSEERIKKDKIEDNLSDNCQQTEKFNVLFSEILNACPIIQLSADTSKNIIVKMPRWISLTDFKIYLNIIKHGIEYNSIFTFNKLLLLSDFFENNEFVEKLVKDNIVPNFDYSNVIDYLENSYLKLSSSKENSLPVNISWFELFIKSIEFVSKNFVFYLNSDNSEYLEKLAGLNKKILEELLDKSIEQIISNPFIFDDEVFDNEILSNMSQSNIYENFKFIQHEIFEKLIDFMHNLRNTSNIFDLLMNEYLRISSDENANEVNSLPNPTLTIEIPVDVNNYYKEFTIDLNIYNRMLVFIVYYKKSDDTLNVSFKLNNLEENSFNKNIDNKFGKNISSPNKKNIGVKSPKNNERTQNNRKTGFESFNKNIKGFFNQSDKKDKERKKNDLNLNKFSSFKILTFLSIVSLNDEKNKTQINTNIIPNNYNKSAYPIYKLNNFSKFIDDIISPIDDVKPKKNKKSTFFSSGTIEFVTIKINLKLCNIHSAITSFILKYFHKFYHEESIFKISKQFFLLLIKNRTSNKYNEDYFVIALLNWLNDEININEECEDICQAINWINVSIDLILEFLMKYPKMVKNCKLQQILEQSLTFNSAKILQRENSLINNFCNMNNTNLINTNLSLNKRIIDESISSTVGLIFKNLLKIGQKMNYSNNNVQIKKFSRFNSLNVGNFNYNLTSKDAPIYHNTDVNYKQKISSRNKKHGNFTTSRSNSKDNKKKYNYFHSKSVEADKFRNIFHERKESEKEGNIKFKIQNKRYENENNFYEENQNNMNNLENLENLQDIKINDGSEKKNEKMKKIENLDEENNNINSDFKNVNLIDNNLFTNNVNPKFEGKNALNSKSYSNFNMVLADGSIRFESSVENCGKNNNFIDKSSSSNIGNLLVPQENLISKDMSKYKIPNKNELKIISSQDSNHPDSEYSYFSSQFNAKTKENQVGKNSKNSISQIHTNFHDVKSYNNGSVYKDSIKFKSKSKNHSKKSIPYIESKEFESFSNLNNLKNPEFNNKIKNTVNVKNIQNPDDDKTLEINNNEDSTPFQFLKNALQVFSKDEEKSQQFSKTNKFDFDLFKEFEIKENSMNKISEIGKKALLNNTINPNSIDKYKGLSRINQKINQEVRRFTYDNIPNKINTSQNNLNYESTNTNTNLNNNNSNSNLNLIGNFCKNDKSNISSQNNTSMNYLFNDNQKLNKNKINYIHRKLNFSNDNLQSENSELVKSYNHIELPNFLTNNFLFTEANHQIDVLNTDFNIQEKNQVVQRIINSGSADQSKNPGVSIQKNYSFKAKKLVDLNLNDSIAYNPVNKIGINNIFKNKTEKKINSSTNNSIGNFTMSNKQIKNNTNISIGNINSQIKQLNKNKVNNQSINNSVYSDMNFSNLKSNVNTNSKTKISFNQSGITSSNTHSITKLNNYQEKIEKDKSNSRNQVFNTGTNELYSYSNYKNMFIKNLKKSSNKSPISPSQSLLNITNKKSFNSNSILGSTNHMNINIHNSGNLNIINKEKSNSKINK